MLQKEIKTFKNDNVERLTDQAIKSIDDLVWKICAPNSANLQKEDFAKDIVQQEVMELIVKFMDSGNHIFA
jgi:hypothetical protein